MLERDMPVLFQHEIKNYFLVMNIGLFKKDVVKPEKNQYKCRVRIIFSITSEI